MTNEESEELQKSNRLEMQKNISASSIFNILVSFYQLKALIAVHGQENTKTFIDKILNVQIVADTNRKLETLCPFHDLDAVTREVLIGYAAPVIMLLTIIILYIMVKIVHCMKLCKRRRFNAI